MNNCCFVRKEISSCLAVLLDISFLVELSQYRSQIKSGRLDALELVAKMSWLNPLPKPLGAVQKFSEVFEAQLCYRFCCLQGTWKAVQKKARRVVMPVF